MIPSTLYLRWASATNTQNPKEPFTRRSAVVRSVSSASSASRNLLRQRGEDNANGLSDTSDKARVLAGYSGAASKSLSAPLTGSASTGHLQLRCVPDEDPWERKRRIERVVRRRDAGIRAKGLAVNNRGTNGRLRDRNRADGAGKHKGVTGQWRGIDRPFAIPL